MLITKNNLNEVLFENQDARLLIEEVVTHTGASLYYYHDIVISAMTAISIYQKALKADEENHPYTISFWEYSATTKTSSASRKPYFA